jgi:hypothetical protein
VLNGNDFEFTYTRSVAAVNEGAVFTVERSATLAPGSWNGSGVSAVILTDNGTTQQVKATFPATTGKFVRLRVSMP